MKTALAYDKVYAFNALCPYYTMFPLEYPLQIIRKYRHLAPVILDPFCGRGTTIYAARKVGVSSYGFDTSPIAAAISRAKLATASVAEVIGLGEDLIAIAPKDVPETPFFKRAFSKQTLLELCSLREGLVKRRSDAAAILRAAALGCLHGPMPKGDGPHSYFSNQMPRTFSSKPDYSVRFWRERELTPPKLHVMDIIRRKLDRISDLETKPSGSTNNIKCADARSPETFDGMPKSTVTITSPPYYGMRTYVQDQWLRMWFMGGEAEIDYQNDDQLCHRGHEAFVSDLAKVWTNVRNHSREDAHLYVRFGTLPSVKSDARQLLKASLEEAKGWRLISVRSAKTSLAGKRQANQMGSESKPSQEYDFHAVVD